MTVLFLTDSLDVHGDAAKWALANRGVQCLLWCSDQFPGNQTLSSRIRSGLRDQIEIDLDKCSLISDFSSIWMRRLPNPHSISEMLNPSDAPMALKEANSAASGLRPLVGKNSTWVNPIESRRLSTLKPVQLITAKKVGWKIPDTLFSNDPNHIKEFYQEYDGNIIYKPFNQGYWRNQKTGKVSAIYASKVPKDLVQDEIALSSCPGIYQQYINKHSELRVTFFGRSYVAARIDSQKTPTAVVDWRADIKHEAAMERAYLPPQVYDKCLAFMQEMNILHGSFDIIQTPKDEYIFLEVNEMGQFLWLEERLNDIPALDMFTSFALNPSSTFEYKANNTSSSISFSKYLSTDCYKSFYKKIENIASITGGHYKVDYAE